MVVAHPALPADGANFDPIYKLLRSKSRGVDWNPVLIGALKSITANRQYPQHRCYQAGWVVQFRCLFCLHTAVSGQQLVASMPEVATISSSDNSSSSASNQCQHRMDPAPEGLSSTSMPSSSTFVSSSSVANLLPSPEVPSTKQALHESATPEQIVAAPVGTLAHRNYVCPALKKERVEHAPSASCTEPRCKPKGT